MAISATVSVDHAHSVIAQARHAWTIAVHANSLEPGKQVASDASAAKADCPPIPPPTETQEPTSIDVFRAVVARASELRIAFANPSTPTATPESAASTTDTLHEVASRASRVTSRLLKNG
jgi:hypothetical protein